MNGDDKANYLFEVSWEVCNKVGGIYTVLKTKMAKACEHFGERYILIGPDLGNNPDFEETDEEVWRAVRDDIAGKGLPCRYGRWKIEGRPKAILVNFYHTYQRDQLLYQLWQDYGVDSMTGQWDYIEPVFFGTAAGEVIEVLFQKLSPEGGAVAQFHEWMSGAGMLHLKKHVPEIASVFTTHATMLGRSLAGSGYNIYDRLDEISPKEMAARMNVIAKHSMEKVLARETDCFTTVSEITAREAEHLLGRRPDVVLPNGIDVSTVSDFNQKPHIIDDHRRIFCEFASKFLQRECPQESTKLFMISGRYEFKNKGIDIFLDALKALKENLAAEKKDHRVVALLSVIGGHFGISQETQQIIRGEQIQRTGFARICTHQLQDPQHDPIWNACNSLNLMNGSDDAVNVIYMPVYLDGFDGLLNMPYYDVLSACDLGIFPSYYEPWGYTPLESALHCVPTVTTDLAGFGMWVQKNAIDGNNRGVAILNYQGRSHAEIVDRLTEHMAGLMNWSKDEIREQKVQARLIAEKTDWKYFYPNYLAAYEAALNIARERLHAVEASAYGNELWYVGTDSVQPRFKSFTVIATLPPKIGRLREIAGNLSWSWNPEVQELFDRLDSELFRSLSRNPEELLEQVDAERLEEMAHNDEYLDLYKRALAIIDHRMGDDKPRDPFITADHPIAYFSTEYGLHESIPIYSGGLGVLSGDHLKTASDMSLPLVGVGLFYKNGYFRQAIDSEGNQNALYPDNDFSRMPARIVQINGSDPLKITVDLPGRRLTAQVWKIAVGKTPLYLLDTAVPENSNQDMQITSRLYGGDQRLRIEQEILLGMGGERLLEGLGIKPALYHLNEGHSAFLLLERIRGFIKRDGLSFAEAREVVKATSVFTTHSPVEAANERFDEPLMRNYFNDYLKDLGISWDTLWELGRDEPAPGKPFSMPVLAFKLTSSANAVSRLHGEVARHMWKKVWSGYEEEEVPIIHITNGIHYSSWVAPEMRDLYRQSLNVDWQHGDVDRCDWGKINDVPDNILWQAHREAKLRVIGRLRDKIASDCERQGLSPLVARRKAAGLKPEALVIGLSRRFATYKRATLLFEDMERFEAIVGSSERPVQVIVAGKSHPGDEGGKSLIKRIYQYSLDNRFMDSLFFLEDYDIEIARWLVQGVDLWLNTPLRKREASGTSGMKAAVNGVLNLSVLDGWWDEAFDDGNGWAVGGEKEYPNIETQNLADSQSLYDVLEGTIIPLFYLRDEGDIPGGWVSMMKGSIQSLAPKYNTHRMLREYYELMYRPIAERGAALQADHCARAKALSEWKMKIASRFSTDHIKWFRIKGFKGDRLSLGEDFQVEVGVEPGKLSEEELRVDLIVTLPKHRIGVIQKPDIVFMKKVKHPGEGEITVFSATYRVTRPGRYAYGVRVLPSHPDLFQYQEIGLVHWA
ncbi:MAG: alpha-glucan family phosphorylase [Deltaproteobacteria bacterium]|nr:alpha-glucan family phosphorylase [Deltaproteobacteria bacterium]